MSTVKIVESGSGGVSVSNMKIGDYAQIVGSNCYNGQIVMRYYIPNEDAIGVVNISDGESTWENPSFYVNILPKGTKIEITV